MMKVTWKLWSSDCDLFCIAKKSPEVRRFWTFKSPEVRRSWDSKSPEVRRFLNSPRIILVLYTQEILLKKFEYKKYRSLNTCSIYHKDGSSLMLWRLRFSTFHNACKISGGPEISNLQKSGGPVILKLKTSGPPAISHSTQLSLMISGWIKGSKKI